MPIRGPHLVPYCSSADGMCVRREIPNIWVKTGAIHVGTAKSLTTDSITGIKPGYRPIRLRKSMKQKGRGLKCAPAPNGRWARQQHVHQCQGCARSPEMSCGSLIYRPLYSNIVQPSKQLSASATKQHVRPGWHGRSFRHPQSLLKQGRRPRVWGPSSHNASALVTAGWPMDALLCQQRRICQAEHQLQIY